MTRIFMSPDYNTTKYVWTDFGGVLTPPVSHTMRVFCQKYGLTESQLRAGFEAGARNHHLTDPSDSYYGGQIPYIPWHSGSAIVTLGWRGWVLNYSFIYTGERYDSSANIRENYVRPWYTSDLTLSRPFTLRRHQLRLTTEVSNLLNQQYEVVRSYPMPGTNFKLKAEYTL